LFDCAPAPAHFLRDLTDAFLVEESAQDAQPLIWPEIVD
jgi:hypothetical protein